MLRACNVLLAGLGAGSFVISSALATEPEQPAHIIAAHIRFQGFRCDNPRGALRDASASGPESPAWVVDCGNAHYRLRLIPGKAVNVEPLE